MGYKNIAVLSSVNSEYKNYADHFIEQLNQLGVDPIAVEWYYGKPENITRQFSEIRKAAWKLRPREDPVIDYDWIDGSLSDYRNFEGSKNSLHILVYDLVTLNSNHILLV